MQRTWEFAILRPMGTIVVSDDPPNINELTADRVIIEYGAKATFLIESMMADVNQYLVDHNEPPNRIIVGAQHYEALIAMASTAKQLPIMPDKVSLCGIALDVVVDPGLEWCRVVGSAQDEYQRAKLKELRP